MNKLKSWGILFGMFLSISTSLQAQSFVETVLKEPIQRALEQNAEVKMKEMEADQSQMEMEAVQGKRLPQVSVLGGYGFLYSKLSPEFPTHYLPISGAAILEDPLVSDFQTQVFMAGISAQQIIYAGGQVSSGIKALEEKQKAERFLAQAGREEVAKEVITTFDQLMLLEEVDKLLKDSEKRLNKEQQKVIKGIENGLAIPYDRDKLQLAILELEEKKVEAEGNREVLYAKLTYLTGMDKKALQSVIYELNPFLLNQTAESPDNRVELKALEAGKKAKEHVYKGEKGTALPSVFAFGNLSYVDAFDSSLKLRDVPVAGDIKLKSEHIRMEPAAAVGVGLKWDVFKGGANRKNIKKAEIDLGISETKLKDTREKLELLLHKNRVDFNTAERKVAVANQQVKIAENNLKLASRQFDSGLVDLTERLASENDFYKVNLNYYNQILNQRKAGIELLMATGELLEKIYDGYEN